VKNYIHWRWPFVTLFLLRGAVHSATGTRYDMKVKILQRRCQPSPSSLLHQISGISSFNCKDSGSRYLRKVGTRCRKIPATKILSRDGDHILRLNKIYVLRILVWHAGKSSNTFRHNLDILPVWLITQNVIKKLSSFMWSRYTETSGKNAMSVSRKIPVGMVRLVRTVKNYENQSSISEHTFRGQRMLTL
jgi:hypothetical protein